jgi:hypothetical protein
VLEQAAQVAAEAGSRLPLIETGVIALSIKATFDIIREILKWRQEKVKAKTVEAQVNLEEAKAYGISLLKDRNGQNKASLVAFCPAHIDMVKQLTGQEKELGFINEKLGDIKVTVDAIRTAVGK